MAPRIPSYNFLNKKMWGPSSVSEPKSILYVTEIGQTITKPFFVNIFSSKGQKPKTTLTKKLKKHPNKKWPKTKNAQNKQKIKTKNAQDPKMSKTKNAQNKNQPKTKEKPKTAQNKQKM